MGACIDKSRFWAKCSECGAHPEKLRDWDGTYWMARHDSGCSNAIDKDSHMSLDDRKEWNKRNGGVQYPNIKPLVCEGSFKECAVHIAETFGYEQSKVWEFYRQPLKDVFSIYKDKFPLFKFDSDRAVFYHCPEFYFIRGVTLALTDGAEFYRSCADRAAWAHENDKKFSVEGWFRHQRELEKNGKVFPDRYFSYVSDSASVYARLLCLSHPEYLTDKTITICNCEVSKFFEEFIGFEVEPIAIEG